MVNFKKILTNTMSLATILGLASCGGEPYHEIPPPTPPVVTTGGSSGGGGTTLNLAPPLTFSFQVTGTGGTTPTYNTPSINTDNILRVKITAGMASQLSLPGYSNFTANYDCVSYTVTALGRTVVTQTLSPNGGGTLCPNAPESQIIDFSDRLAPGHGPVTITIDRVRYDFYCKLWEQCQSQLFINEGCYWSFNPSTENMYCPLRTVYRNHTATGSLAIQVNGTTL